jgi:hypothetical protein
MSKKPGLRSPSPLEWLLGGIVVVCLFLLLTQDFNLILQVFYSRFSFLILVLMIIEFLILKSIDRSKVYRMELERLRELQDAELIVKRRLESRLEQLLQKATQLAAEPGSSPSLNELREELRQSLEQLRLH